MRYAPCILFFLACLLAPPHPNACAQDDGQKALDALNKALGAPKEQAPAQKPPSKDKSAVDALDKALEKPAEPSKQQPSGKQAQPPRGKAKREAKPDAPSQQAQSPVLPGPAANFAAYGPQLDHLFFFESGRETPKKNERTYQNSFVISATRFVNWELSYVLSNTFDAQLAVKIKAVWKHPDGKIIEDEGDFHISPEWRRVTWTWGRGADQPGHWQKGTHALDIYIDGKLATSASFIMM